MAPKSFNDAARPRLLFITQKIKQDDDDLAFTILWIQQFIREGFEVSVICLEKGAFDDSFPVYSLGKENGAGKVRQILRFLRLITTLKYDRVFVHMNPEYFTLGGWWWYVRGIPSYFWYTHYTMSMHVRLAGWFSTRMFAATPQSLPQYEGSAKRVILSHGIDTEFWGEPHQESEADPHHLVSIHRLSRSKRVEIALRTLVLLPEYTLDIYGRPIDQTYYDELQTLVRDLGLTDRVRFLGPRPMPELREIYPQYRLMLNFAYETIDKTMLEGMLFGVYPVTTTANAQAIGLPIYSSDDEPETLATFIRDGAWKKMDRAALRELVLERHSLAKLVSRMAEYMRPGL